MKTAKEWLESLYAKRDDGGERYLKGGRAILLESDIAEIQAEAFEAGQRTGYKAVFDALTKKADKRAKKP